MCIRDSKDGFILIDSSQGLGVLRINTVVAIKPGNSRNLEKRNFNGDDEAVVGIGTLIVFIAMILIAAVAASVLIQTSENLQSRAMAVGKQTTRDVSSGMKIVGVTGYTDVAKTKIEYLAISIQLRAGSYDLSLNATNLYIQYDNMTVLSLDYTDNNMILGSVNTQGIFHTLNMSNISATDFGVIALRDSDNSIINSYGMSSKDLAILMINLTAILQETSGLATGQDITGRIIPEVGSAGTFLITAPNSYEYRVVELW